MLGKAIGVFSILGLVACSEAQNSSGKIIGGKDASQDYEFFVGLYETGYLDSSFCGGTLVAPDVVVTAAHCVSAPYGDLEVGLALKSNKNPSPDQLRRVKAVQVHPDYPSADSDIALLFLESRPDDFTQLKPLKINTTADWPAPAAEVRVIGHGNSTSYGWLDAPVLQEVDVPIVDNESCKKIYPDVNDAKICAGLMLDGGKDSCQGDSGGPLFTTGTDPQFIGIVSYGNGCAQKSAPGVYTRVSSYANWIAEQIEAYRNPAVPTLESLAGLVASYCYAPGYNEVELTNGRDSVLYSSSLQVDLSAPIPLSKGESWPSIQARDGLSEVKRCAFTLPNGHDVEVIQAKNESDTVPSYRGFVRLDTRWYEAKAKEGQSANYECAATDSEVKSLTAQFNNSVYGPALWSINLDEAPYDAWPIENEPTNIGEAFRCDVKGYGLNVYKSDDNLYAKVQLGTAAPYWFQLWKYQLSADPVTATLKPLSSQLGVLEITNDGYSDLFTWNLSCEVPFSLKDRQGAIHEAQSNQGRWDVYFGFPNSFNAAIAKTYSRSFTIKLNDMSIEDLPNKGCTINNTSLPITVENGF
jgi:secreted trypsin-like serine protease